MEKIKLSRNSALRLMVSDGGNIKNLLVCFNIAVKSLVVAIIMEVVVAFGMMSLWGNQDTVCTVQTEIVTGIQI